MKSLTVELIPDPEMGGFTARVPDIPAYGEGETEDAAIEDLKQALAAYPISRVSGFRHHPNPGEPLRDGAPGTKAWEA